MLRTMDTDDVFEDLVRTMKKEFVQYFESKSLYQNYAESVESFKTGRNINPKENINKDVVELESTIDTLNKKIETLESRMFENQRGYYKELERHREAKIMMMKSELHSTKVGEEYLLVKFFEEEDFFQPSED